MTSERIMGKTLNGGDYSEIFYFDEDGNLTDPPSVSAVAHMSTEDIFDGEEIEQAGIYEDGDFTFPTDFFTLLSKIRYWNTRRI